MVGEAPRRGPDSRGWVNKSNETIELPDPEAQANLRRLEAEAERINLEVARAEQGDTIEMEADPDTEEVEDAADAPTDKVEIGLAGGAAGTSLEPTAPTGEKYVGNDVGEQELSDEGRAKLEQETEATVSQGLIDLDQRLNQEGANPTEYLKTFKDELQEQKQGLAAAESGNQQEIARAFQMKIAALEAQIDMLDLEINDEDVIAERQEKQRRAAAAPKKEPSAQAKRMLASAREAMLTPAERAELKKAKEKLESSSDDMKLTG